MFEDFDVECSEVKVFIDLEVKKAQLLDASDNVFDVSEKDYIIEDVALNLAEETDVR